jgi:flavin reductase (DIM6/NTAB) family NADH-FMN oxidoreductase RutF/ADP-ribose pyrophosphatase YjhB (NUDIX family)
VTTLTSATGADSRALRDLFGTFLTGVTVVTLWDESGSPTGFTANSFTSVSLEPPLILVCVANTSRSQGMLAAAERFGVNILSDGQRDTSNAFAARSGTKFEGVPRWSEPGGPPLIEGSLGAIDCRREQTILAGDHSVVIGRVLGYQREQGRPLGYYGGGYVTFGLGSDALERHGGAVIVGAVAALENRVLLVRRAGQPLWEIPATPLRPGERHETALPRLLASLGVQAEVSFLFSIFQVPGEFRTRMIFRAALAGPAPASRLPDGAEIALFSEEQAPWTLVGRSEGTVLRRFFSEQATARFGIYWDSEDGGRVAPLEGVPLPWSQYGDGGRDGAVPPNPAR